MYKNILVPVDPAHPEKHAHALGGAADAEVAEKRA